MNLIPLYLCILTVIAIVAQVSDVVPGPLVTYTIYCLWIIVYVWIGGGLGYFAGLFYATTLWWRDLLYILYLLLFLIFSIHLLKRFRFGDDDKSKLCMVNQCSLFRSKNNVFFFSFKLAFSQFLCFKKPQPLSVLSRESQRHCSLEILSDTLWKLEYVSVK